MKGKPYVGWREVPKRNQIEYTQTTPLTDEQGRLSIKGGWARHNVFAYDRTLTRPQWRGKEWDFYQIANGRYMVQVSVANISVGGYCAAMAVDLTTGQVLCNATSLFLGGKNKVVLPQNGDEPNHFHYAKGGFSFDEDTKSHQRTLSFVGKEQGKEVQAMFCMTLLPNHESCVTVTPFVRHGRMMPTRFFLTQKQNCMPTEGYLQCGELRLDFSAEDTFTVMDWGRGVWPHREVWFWGNGSTYLTASDGTRHLFGFEITWGIGNEDNATATCLFYDGVAHKIGSVDVETFPKPDRYNQPWHFISDDGRLDLTMTPFYDHHSDLNALVARMHTHQVHGRWNGTVILDDGTPLAIRDMYAFCEYVENRW